MSYYRNVYLRSDEWKTLRLAKLHAQKNKCQICGFVSEHNDVHHVIYGRLYDVTLSDLKVLCRACHDKTHELLEKYPKLKKLKRSQIWKVIIDHLKKIERDRRMLRKKDPIPRSRRKKRVLAVPAFVRARNQLVKLGFVFKKRMPWKDVLLDCPRILLEIKPTEKFIVFYEALTGINPRRFDFEPMQKPLAVLENEPTHDFLCHSDF